MSETLSWTRGRAKSCYNRRPLIAYRARYSHINFADKLNLSARPIDLAPRNVPAPVDADESLQGEDREFLDWLLDRAGVSVSHYRPESLARRLPACLRILRANSPAHARTVIERNSNLTGRAIGAVLIGVTSFFRDKQVFEDLDHHVLSKLADRAAARIWSVGCSDGMELYSVAMQLAERGALHRCELVGTDCRLPATRIAAAGVYLDEAVRDVPEHLRSRYFVASDAKTHSISATLRSQIQWRTADVMGTPEPGPWDLILCRNMAMYMRSDAVGRLWDILQNALRPGGYLVLGKAERPGGARRMSMIAPCIFRRD
jgi:chemotaxis methyl-accepting protein methylase